jgi:late competence protein required for DNA uptake (superfamily II DNA/RNA helicase)
MEMNTCKAIMEQKDAKGKKCWRPPKENGYCGIHQKQSLIQNEIELKKRKCKTYRCIEFLNPESTDMYCKLCITIKESTSKKCVKQ